VISPDDLDTQQTIDSTDVGVRLLTQPLTQSHSLDNIDLSQGSLIAVVSLSHLHAIESPLLSQAQILVVEDFIQQQVMAASNVLLPTTEIFRDTTLIVEYEGRLILLAPESRTEIVKDV
jgi:hypothetical protein